MQEDSEGKKKRLAVHALHYELTPDEIFQVIRTELVKAQNAAAAGVPASGKGRAPPRGYVCKTHNIYRVVEDLDPEKSEVRVYQCRSSTSCESTSKWAKKQASAAAAEAGRGPPPRNGLADHKLCHRCGSADHWVAQCPQPPTEKDLADRAAKGGKTRRRKGGKKGGKKG